MRIQRIQQYSIENNKNRSMPRQSIAFRKSRKISDAAESVLRYLFVFFAIFQIPIVAGLMCLNTYYDIEQKRKDDIREDEILKQISEAAQPNQISLQYVAPQVRALMKEEPMFFKEKYWDEKIPVLTEKAIKQWQDAKTSIRNKTAKFWQEQSKHVQYVQETIKSDEFQDYLNKSKRREEEFKSKNPNKKPFKIYNLSYSECNSSIGGLIAQINEYAIKDNARKVQVGSETTAVLGNSGIYTRLGQNLKKIEYRTTPKYKMVYPDNIISFAHHDENNMSIVIHSYKK